MPQTFQLDYKVQVVHQPLGTTYLLWYELLDLVYSFGNLCADIVKSVPIHTVPTILHFKLLLALSNASIKSVRGAS